MKLEEMVLALQNALDDKKGLDIKVINLEGRSAFADYFIIATGTSSTHVASLADEVDRVASKNRWRVWGREGLPLAEWVLVDMGEIIIHVFQRETRAMYNLEKLWNPKTLMSGELNITAEEDEFLHDEEEDSPHAEEEFLDDEDDGDDEEEEPADVVEEEEPAHVEEEPVVAVKKSSRKSDAKEKKDDKKKGDKKKDKGKK